MGDVIQLCETPRVSGVTMPDEPDIVQIKSDGLRRAVTYWLLLAEQWRRMIELPPALANMKPATGRASSRLQDILEARRYHTSDRRDDR